MYLKNKISYILKQKTPPIDYLPKFVFFVMWMCNSNRVMCTRGREMEEKEI